METKDRISAFRVFMTGPDGASFVQPDMVRWLTSKGFFTAPASKKYHGAYEGGLFDHSLRVAETLVSLTEDCRLTWDSSRSPYIVGMFHDLCKIDQYRHPVTDAGVWEDNPNPILRGHGEKSVMLLSQFYTLTEDEIVCIRYHMGAFTDKSEWNDYTRAVKEHPNTLWTHHADMLASHVLGV